MTLTQILNIIGSECDPNRVFIRVKEVLDMIKKKYIWERDQWPNFTWDLNSVMPLLLEAKKAQGRIVSLSKQISSEDIGNLLAIEAIETSAIEGEKLDLNDVRSSVAKRLNLPSAGLSKSSKRSDGLIDALIDATSKNSILTHDRLFQWHKMLFADFSKYSSIDSESVGAYRKSIEPMRVISGAMGKEVIHYEAPPSTIVYKEMELFLRWFNSSNDDGLITAAVAHLWFISIHPFEDGNGRIARCITDMAIAREDHLEQRLYSLSNQISSDRKKYYEILEETQKGSGDLTDWINWFCQTVIKSISYSEKLVEKSMFIARFYQTIAAVSFNERQLKVIKKLLENCDSEFNITNKRYISIAKTSPESAKRDLKDLVEKKILLKNEGGGRSVSYRLNKELSFDR